MSHEFSLRTYRPGDEQQIQQLFSAVFRAARPIEEWRWRFRDAPCGEASIQVIEHRGEIVGHYAHVPFETFVNGNKHRLAHGGDMMVRGDMRNQGLMKVLVEDYVKNMTGFDLRTNFPSPKAGRLAEKYGGGRLIGQMDTWRRYRARPSGIHLRGLRDSSSGLLGHALERVPPTPARILRLREVDEPDPQFDDLAQISANFAPCIRIRDKAYITWRWREQPNSDWRIHAAYDEGGRLRGWIVYGVDEGSRPFIPPGGYIVDILAEDFSTSRLLLADASRRLLREGASVVYLDYADPRVWAARACRAAGFVTRRNGPNVIVRSFSERLSAEVERLDNWYLTRGDTDFA